MKKRFEPLEISGLKPIPQQQQLSVGETEEKYGTLIETVLTKYFKYPAFRDRQREVIISVLSGRDTFVLMPTGAGKSLCFQIPALVLPGVSIVVSPLIALMQDQVSALKSRNIPSEQYNSSISEKEKQRIIQDLKLKTPNTKLLYVTPEMIATEGFTYHLTSLHSRGLLGSFVIDESHCISKWGVGFRPQYRNLRVLKEKFPHVPVIALTASATKTVREDIVKSLSLKNPNVFIASFNRPNIKYFVRFKDLMPNLVNDIVETIRNLKSLLDGESSGKAKASKELEQFCGIVYSHKKSDCDALAERLRESKLSATAYHAGLSNENRKTVLSDWLSGKVKIVIATIAFGMGIDKADVRFVLHHTLSKSLEDFYQESGRAGRDGKAAVSIVYYGAEDRSLMDFLIDKTEEKSKKIHQEAFKGMVDYCLKASCRRQNLIEYFGEKNVKCNKTCDFCTDPGKVKNKIAELERPRNTFIQLTSFRAPSKFNEEEQEYLSIFGDTSTLKTFKNPSRKKFGGGSTGYSQSEVTVELPIFDDDPENFFSALKEAEQKYAGRNIQDVNFTTANKLIREVKKKDEKSDAEKLRKAAEVMKAQNNKNNTLSQNSSLSLKGFNTRNFNISGTETNTLSGLKPTLQKVPSITSGLLKTPQNSLQKTSLLSPSPELGSLKGLSKNTLTIAPRDIPKIEPMNPTRVPNKETQKPKALPAKAIFNSSLDFYNLSQTKPKESVVTETSKKKVINLSDSSNSEDLSSQHPTKQFLPQEEDWESPDVDDRETESGSQNEIVKSGEGDEPLPIPNKKRQSISNYFQKISTSPSVPSPPFIKEKEKEKEKVKEKEKPKKATKPKKRKQEQIDPLQKDLFTYIPNKKLKNSNSIPTPTNN